MLQIFSIIICSTFTDKNHNKKDDYLSYPFNGNYVFDPESKNINDQQLVIPEKNESQFYISSVNNGNNFILNGHGNLETRKLSFDQNNLNQYKIFNDPYNQLKRKRRHSEATTSEAGPINLSKKPKYDSEIQNTFQLPDNKNTTNLQALENFVKKTEFELLCEKLKDFIIKNKKVKLKEATNFSESIEFKDKSTKTTISKFSNKIFRWRVQILLVISKHLSSLKFKIQGTSIDKEVKKPLIKYLDCVIDVLQYIVNILPEDQNNRFCVCRLLVAYVNAYLYIPKVLNLCDVLKLYEEFEKNIKSVETNINYKFSEAVQELVKSTKDEITYVLWDVNKLLKDIHSAIGCINKYRKKK